MLRFFHDPGKGCLRGWTPAAFVHFSLWKKGNCKCWLLSLTQSLGNNKMAHSCPTYYKEVTQSYSEIRALTLLRPSSLYCLKTIITCITYAIEKTERKNWDGAKRSAQKTRGERILLVVCQVCSGPFPICHCLQGFRMKEDRLRPVLFPVSIHFHCYTRTTDWVIWRLGSPRSRVTSTADLLTESQSGRKHHSGKN